MRVGKEQSGTIYFNQANYKLQTKNYKAQTSYILEGEQKNIHGRINQWQFIMIIYIDIENIPSKVFIDYFVAIKLHPHQLMTSPEGINNISPAVKTGETAYFLNHEG